MSEDKTSPVKNGNGKQEPIRVGRLTLTTCIDLPGAPAAKVVVATPDDAQENRMRMRILYLPWLRHHRVEADSPGRPTVVKYVHETHADWEPFPES